MVLVELKGLVLGAGVELREADVEWARADAKDGGPGVKDCSLPNLEFSTMFLFLKLGDKPTFPGAMTVYEE